MAKNTYYPQLYKCCECDHKRKEYIWSNEIQDKSFPCNLNACQGEMLPYFEGEIDAPMVMGRKMTSDEIKADRRKRNKLHFEKEIMPGLPKKEQLHFFAKGYRNR